MYKYDMYKSLKERIEKLKEMSFDFQYEKIDWKEIRTIPLLYQFLVLNNTILNLKNQEQEIELSNMLDRIIVETFKKLNPDFSNNNIQTIVKAFKMAYTVYPIDIYVISNAVFMKRARLNEHNIPERLDITLINLCESYYSINKSKYFSLSDGIQANLNSNEIESIRQRISNYIKDTLSLYYSNDFINRVFDLDPNEDNYGKNGIFHEYANVKNVFLDRTYSDIIKTIIDRCEYNIEMIVQNEEEFAQFNIHQTFIDNVLVWNIEKIETPVWRLSETILEQEKKVIQKKLSQANY